jgi:hypothetical protein
VRTFRLRAASRNSASESLPFRLLSKDSKARFRARPSPPSSTVRKRDRMGCDHANKSISNGDNRTQLESRYLQFLLCRRPATGVERSEGEHNTETLPRATKPDYLTSQAETHFRNSRNRMVVPLTENRLTILLASSLVSGMPVTAETTVSHLRRTSYNVGSLPILSRADSNSYTSTWPSRWWSMSAKIYTNESDAQGSLSKVGHHKETQAERTDLFDALAMFAVPAKVLAQSEDHVVQYTVRPA